jgi:hypothetical protein
LDRDRAVRAVEAGRRWPPSPGGEATAGQPRNPNGACLPGQPDAAGSADMLASPHQQELLKGQQGNEAQLQPQQ